MLSKKAIVSAMRQFIDSERVLSEPEDLITYSFDGTPYINGYCSASQCR